MKPYKIILLGILVCLISLYFMSGLWGSDGVAIGGYSFPVGIVISIIGLIKDE